MKKRILGLFVSAALIIGLSSLQASVLTKSTKMIADTRATTGHFEVIDFIWPCEYPWQYPPLCE